MLLLPAYLTFASLSLSLSRTHDYRGWAGHNCFLAQLKGRRCWVTGNIPTCSFGHLVCFVLANSRNAIVAARSCAYLRGCPFGFDSVRCKRVRVWGRCEPEVTTECLCVKPCVRIPFLIVAVADEKLKESMK